MTDGRTGHLYERVRVRVGLEFMFSVLPKCHKVTNLYSPSVRNSIRLGTKVPHYYYYYMRCAQ